MKKLPEKAMAYANISPVSGTCFYWEVEKTAKQMDFGTILKEKLVLIFFIGVKISLRIIQDHT
jgi:hypothetical protein